MLARKICKKADEEAKKLHYMNENDRTKYIHTRIMYHERTHSKGESIAANTSNAGGSIHRELLVRREIERESEMVCTCFCQCTANVLCMRQRERHG